MRHQVVDGSPRSLAAVRSLAVCLAASVAGGCSVQPRTPYTQDDAANAELVGYSNIRVWLDGEVPNPKEFGPSAATGKASTYLALSGGGGNGAYGAGILNGWTQSGTRPMSQPCRESARAR